MKLLRDEDAGFFKSFIKGFKENFKQSTVIWIIELLVGCFLSYDWYLIYKNGFENYNRIFVILLAVVTVFLAMAFLAVFALVARFKMSPRKALPLRLPLPCIPRSPWASTRACPLPRTR